MLWYIALLLFYTRKVKIDTSKKKKICEILNKFVDLVYNTY